MELTISWPQAFLKALRWGAKNKRRVKTDESDKNRRLSAIERIPLMKPRDFYITTLESHHLG